MKPRVPARTSASLDTNLAPGHIRDEAQHVREPTACIDDILTKIRPIITYGDLFLRNAHAVHARETDLPARIGAHIMLGDFVRSLLVGAQGRVLDVMERRGEREEPQSRVKRGQAEEGAKDQGPAGAELAGRSGVGAIKPSPQRRPRSVEGRRGSRSRGRNSR